MCFPRDRRSSEYLCLIRPVEILRGIFFRKCQIFALNANIMTFCKELMQSPWSIMEQQINVSLPGNRRKERELNDSGIQAIL